MLGLARLGRTRPNGMQLDGAQSGRVRFGRFRVGWGPTASRPRRRNALCMLAMASIGAALGAPSPSARADSAVTLYGTFDTSIEVTNPGAGWVTRMDSGAYRGSRFGVRGEEDIGDGMAIIFDLENGFGSNDGSFAVDGSLFNRQAWVGLVAPWGTLRFGRQYSPIYIPFKGQLDAFGAGTIASGLDNLSKITPYESNALTWISPEFYGFSTTLMAALRDPSDADGNGLGAQIETFAWRNESLRLSFAHQQTHGDGALRANLGGLSYALGAVTSYLSFFNGDGGTPRYHDDGVSVSTQYAWSARVRASLGYTFVRDRSGGDNDADQFSAACEYDLSKHVMLYASAGWLSNHANATFTLRGVNVTGLPPSWPGAPVRGVQLGMIDRF
jgi:predicted porin